ncbi:hypothetical protein [Methylobacterium oxalidis]|uniref:hypothetical protein n=1 Tax=Methylobacterium oxalidis TaxID=944322 RepID=UPI003316248B
MTETRKPLNPLERRENIGIVDGSDHAGEHVTSSRHGIGADPVRTDSPRDAAEPHQSRTETGKPLNPLERQENIGIVDRSDHAGEHVTSSRHGIGTDPARR